MRILFSIVGLLVVLAILAFTAKQQLRAVAPPPSPSSPAAENTPAPAPTPQQTVQQAQQEVQRALEQGAARASEADR